MIREIVREFLQGLEAGQDARARTFTRQELFWQAIEIVRIKLRGEVGEDSVMRALDAELGERVRAKRIVRAGRGVYRLPDAGAGNPPPSDPAGDRIAFSGLPPIDQERLRRLVPPAPAEAGQGRLARELFAKGLGGLDARDFVASGLLSLQADEYASLFSLQDFAL